MKFFPTSKTLPCAICGDSKGKCRSKNDQGKRFILCMRVGNAAKGERCNGFKCINPNGKSNWASTWVEVIEQDKDYSPKLAQERRQQTEEEERRHQNFLKSGLSCRQRGKNFTLMSRHSGLSKIHTESLSERGLSDEASKRFFSVSPNQLLPKEIDPKTPGVSFGNKLAVAQSSLACPAFDPEGNIIGYQLRLDEATENKYRWLKGQYSSHLRNGELPLTVARPVTGNPIGIAMSEGVLKPYVAAQIHQKIFLGASGSNFASSPEQVQRYLKIVSAEIGVKTIDFYPDAGAVSNIHIVRAYRKTFDLLARLGYQVRVAWWGQAKKLHKDCDEITSHEAITYLSLLEFEEICIQHGAFIPVANSEPTEEKLTEEKLEAQRKEEFYGKVIAVQRPLRSLTYTPDFLYAPSVANIANDSKARFLPNLVDIVPKSGILFLRAPKGSGKSHQIKEIKDYHCGHNAVIDEVEIDGKAKPVKEFIPGLGKKFLSITPRIALGRGQAEDWEYTWIDDISAQMSAVEGGEHQMLNEVLEVGGCFDSFWKFANRDFSNHLMVLDECELGLTHLISSSTLKNNRPLTLKLFEQKVKECLENDGLLILSDADLSDVSVDYIRSICPTAPVFLVDYQGCPNPWEIDYYTGYQDEVEKLILEWFDSEINPDSFQEPIFVTCDSQDEAEALEKQLLKLYPELLGGQTGGIVRIDSTVTQTDFGRNFVKFINKSIEESKPRILIATPSLGVGVSIDIPWFKHVFGLFFGTVEPSQARQQLARVRQPVPRTVWARDVGNIERGIMGSFFPEEIKSNLFQHHESTSDLIGIALELAKDSVENRCDKDILPALIKTLQCMMDEKGNWNNKHVDLRCKTQARRNFSMSQYALNLRQELIEEGHYLADYGCPDKVGAGEDVREQKKQDKLTEAASISNSLDIELEVAKQKIMKPTRSTEEGYQIQKAFLKDELPGVELSPEFVHKAVTSDRGRWKAGIKLFWHCQRLDATKTRDLSEWRYKLKLFESGLPFLPDIKTRSLQCKAILESGILKFLSSEMLKNEYINESPEIRGFWQWAESHRSLLQKAFGVAIGKEPIKLLNRLLLKIGMGLMPARTEKLPNGNKLRYYRIDAKKLMDSDRENILQALDLRWQLSQQEKSKRELAWLEKEVLEAEEAVALKPVAPISQNQDGMQKSWCHDLYTYNILGGRDTACVADREGISGDFEAKSETEQLVEAFEFCDTPETFESVIEGEASEDIENAIALMPQPRQLELETWFKATLQPASTGVEELTALLPYADTPEIFADVIEGEDLHDIDTAIALMPTQPIRSLLRSFREAVYGVSEYLYGNIADRLTNATQSISMSPERPY